MTVKIGVVSSNRDHYKYKSKFASKIIVEQDISEIFRSTRTRKTIPLSNTRNICLSEFSILHDFSREQAQLKSRIKLHFKIGRFI